MQGRVRGCSNKCLLVQGKKAKAAARPKTYALHEDEDGWEGIQEAQNAAATRALFQVDAASCKSAIPEHTPTMYIVLHAPQES